jgi:enamine deaminase RidA (YjgF/YER057c/UK114 family)
VRQINNTREHPTLNFRHGEPWDLAKVAEYDAVLIATDHDGVDYASLSANAKLVLDTRNACARAGADMTNVVKREGLVRNEARVRSWSKRWNRLRTVAVLTQLRRELARKAAVRDRSADDG